MLRLQINHGDAEEVKWDHRLQILDASPRMTYILINGYFLVVVLGRTLGKLNVQDPTVQVSFIILSLY